MTFKQPNRLPEANIQAEIYHRCRLLNIQCILEYKDYSVGRSHCRLDILILRNNSPVGIVEVKSHKQNRKSLKAPHNLQIAKYSKLGLPILYCGHVDQIDELVLEIQKWIP